MIMEILLLILWIIYINNAYGILSKQQQTYIRNILNHPNTPTNIENETRRILAKEYYPWFLYQYKSFVFDKNNKKLLYRTKPNRIELQMYAVTGYLSAIRNYNGKSAFSKYARGYILGSIYKGITDMSPLKPMSHYYRKKKNFTMTSKLIPYTDYWMFDEWNPPKIEDNTHNYLSIKIHGIVSKLPNVDKKTFYLRYDKNTLKIKTHVKQICEIMCYSHETYRKIMKKNMEHIRSQIEYDVV